jgi:3-oxoacyl-[acyl-carrier-protein] synthase-3
VPSLDKGDFVDLNKRRAVIVGTGRYTGERVLTINDVLKDFNIDPNNPSDEVKSTIEKASVLRRKILDPNNEDECTSALFIKAGLKAIADAGIKPSDIGLLICVTDTPDFLIPATSARVHHGLKLEGAGFFDLNASCAGFTIALNMASSYLRCEEDAKHVLVIGGNVYSKFLDPNDLSDQFLFSDGAGALVLRGEESEYGILKSTLKGMGEYWEYWGLFAGGSWKGYSPKALEEGQHKLRKVYPYGGGFNLKQWPPVILETIKKSNWKNEDVDIAFMTQSRKYVLDIICDIVGWKHEVSFNTHEEYGYLGSACIPVAMDVAREKGALKKGQKVLICTSGAGYSCTTLSLIWGI